MILQKYQEARAKGDNNVILDRLYNEYLTAKHGNDPQWLRMELLKSEVEPYLHVSLEHVNAMFGTEEARKKALFPKWWKSLDEIATDMTAEQLMEQFATWFADQTIDTASIPPAVPLQNEDENAME